MDIFDSRFYRINAKLLALIGQWPYHESIKQTIHQVLVHICVITVILSQGVKLFEIWGDVDIMIECATPMGVQIIACIKSINCIINRNKMTSLLDTMKINWTELRKSEEIDILKRYAEQGRTLTLLYSGYLYIAMVAYLLIPLIPRILDLAIPLNTSRPPTYLYQTQYYVDPEEYFLPILMHTYIGTALTVTTVIAVDTMYTTYVQHVCGLLEIIGHRLENLSRDTDVDIDVNPSKDEDRCYHELTRCINQHNNAIEFASLIETTYSTAYLFEIGIGIALLSISGVQVLIKLGQYEEIIRLAQFIIAQLSHIMFNSWPGQKLMDQCSRFRHSLYFSHWYLFSLRARKLLKLVMIRAVTPQKITAGQIYEMSMENCGAIIQTSVSYFTVFASLR